MESEANKEYLEKLDESFEQVKSGNTISFTMEELKEMESENWTPTKRFQNFYKNRNLCIDVIYN